MFNEAFSFGQSPKGNPACTQNTVESLTGMRVDHTIVANFAGFAALTKVVGGVRVCLPHALYQGDLNPNLPTQGKLVFKAGIQRVSGAKALDYVRIRHGIGDGSDIGRIRRQQAFLASVVRKVRAEGLSPTHLLPLAEAATKYFTVDPDLGSPAKLLSFAMSMRHIQTKDITFVTTPWRYDGARVALVHPAVDRLWTALKADQPLTKSETADGAVPDGVHFPGVLADRNADVAGQDEGDHHAGERAQRHPDQQPGRRHLAEAAPDGAEHRLGHERKHRRLPAHGHRLRPRRAGRRHGAAVAVHRRLRSSRPTSPGCGSSSVSSTACRRTPPVRSRSRGA